MDALLAVASKRDVRAYRGEPIAAQTEAWILDAGRLSGSARNRQPCRFVVAEGDARAAVAAAVYAPRNVLGAALVVTVTVTPGGGLVDFDAGRVAQSMMLAAWAQGVASCPNGIADPDALRRALGIVDPERPVIVLGFGHPASGRDPDRRSAQEWSRRAPRLPLEQLVRRVGSAPS
jgi:nitroreductase